MKEQNFQRALKIKNEIMFLEQEMNALDYAREKITKQSRSRAKRRRRCEISRPFANRENKGRPRYQKDCR